MLEQQENRGAENESVKPTIIYPTTPEADADGFFIQNEDDAANNVFTKVYENGNKVKKTELPVSKKTAIVRELIGRDTIELSRYMNGKQERYNTAMITMAATIDGVKKTYEEIDDLKMKDYQALLALCGELNF